MPPDIKELMKCLTFHEFLFKWAVAKRVWRINIAIALVVGLALIPHIVFGEEAWFWMATLCFITSQGLVLTGSYFVAKDDWHHCEMTRALQEYDEYE